MPQSSSNQKAASSTKSLGIGGIGAGSTSGSTATGANSSGGVLGQTGIGASSPGMPALQHRFIVRVESTPQTFTERSIAFAMNFAKKECVLAVEQSVTSTTREHAVIQDWIDNPKRQVTLELMDHNQNVVDIIKFKETSVEDHAVDFNHGMSGAVVHVLILSYQQIDLGSGGNAAASAFANAMSIIGKP